MVKFDGNVFQVCYKYINRFAEPSLAGLKFNDMMGTERVTFSQAHCQVKHLAY